MRGFLSGRRKVDPIANAVAATVEVVVEDGQGSGFIVDSAGMLVTAHHVVWHGARSLRTVKVHLFPEQENCREEEATVFASHRRLDYALLWLAKGPVLPYLPIGDPQLLRHAQTVYAVGAPLGRPNTVSRGIVSNPCARQNGVEWIQTDAAMDPGNSGGPLVNERGQVVGINSRGVDQADALKFAVPIDYLVSDIQTARAAGREKCLAAAYCLACGYTDYTPSAWYCPNCGAPREDDSGSPNQPEH